MDDIVKKQIESLLFSANKPVSVKEIHDITGLSSQKITHSLKFLRKDFQERDSAMEIVKIGKKYIMQIPGKFNDQTMMIASPAIDNETLKTLTLIAFHQPIKQSNLRRLAGEKIYEHVDKLSDLGLIHTKKYKSTEILKLTPRFFEYFGIEPRKPDEIRSFLLEKVTKQTVEINNKKNNEENIQ